MLFVLQTHDIGELIRNVASTWNSERKRQAVSVMTLSVFGNISDTENTPVTAVRNIALLSSTISDNRAAV